MPTEQFRDKTEEAEQEEARWELEAEIPSRPQSR
jgi:hypothetical protein